MNIVSLSAFTDNYIWLLHNGQRALAVDPGDDLPVKKALDELGLQLEAILVTHHHADHTGGVQALRAATGATVHGPARDAIPGPSVPHHGGDVIALLGLPWTVLDVPGHTAGHIAWFCPAVDGAPLLFCGDTLFSGGCGRLFEGTPAEMLASLDTLAALPADTRVCCAHEYTLSNLAFALAVEPDNLDLIRHDTVCQSLRAQGQPTLPTTIGLERRINPFLRTREDTVRQAIRRWHPAPHGEVAEFAALRQWKNEFK